MNDVHIVAGPPRVSIQEIRLKIVEHLAGTRVVRAILFGSFARGTADMGSDVDLVLIEPTSRPFVERGLAHLPLFRLGVGIDLFVYTPEEFEHLRCDRNPFVERIEAEGEEVYVRPGN
jgi:predicted nucleotidyltransferase